MKKILQMDRTRSIATKMKVNDYQAIDLTMPDKLFRLAPSTHNIITIHARGICHYQIDKIGRAKQDFDMALTLAKRKEDALLEYEVQDTIDAIARLETEEEKQLWLNMKLEYCTNNFFEIKEEFEEMYRVVKQADRDFSKSIERAPNEKKKEYLQESMRRNKMICNFLPEFIFRLNHKINSAFLLSMAA